MQTLHRLRFGTFAFVLGAVLLTGGVLILSGTTPPLLEPFGDIIGWSFIILNEILGLTALFMLLRDKKGGRGAGRSGQRRTDEPRPQREPEFELGQQPFASQTTEEMPL